MKMYNSEPEKSPQAKANINLEVDLMQDSKILLSAAFKPISGLRPYWCDHYTRLSYYTRRDQILKRALPTEHNRARHCV